VTVGHNPPVPASPRCCFWLSGHWVSGPRYLALRTWVSLSGPGFQDLEKRALGFTLRTWVSGPRKLSILRSTYLFPVTFLCVHRHFSLRPPSLFSASSGHRRTDARTDPFVRPSVHPSVRAGSAIENASRWSVIGRAGSAVENASRTPSHPTTDLVNLYIRLDTYYAMVN